MKSFRLAHFSDVHVTLNPLAQPLVGLLGKRGAGAINYFAGGRGRRFKDVERQLVALLGDIEAQGVDHALCTGDLTGMSYEAELARCTAIFGARLSDPERWTVIPGNHDRYTEEAAADRAFERHFGALAAPSYPFRKALAGDVSLIALDVARPTSFFDSSGQCGADQLARARELLRSPDLVGQFVVLALHYGLFRASGRPDRRSHGIRDWSQLWDLLDAAPVDLVLHGHMHGAYRLVLRGKRLACAGSATDLHHGSGYDIYTIEPDGKRLSVERRVWAPANGRYERQPGSTAAEWSNVGTA